MDTVVLKFGGSSVADNIKLNIVADKIIEFKKKNNKVVVVVSAQGKTTDKLIKEAKELALNPNEREMDVLLSTGEQVTIAKLAILLNRLGFKAISLTGWQAGILTNGRNTDSSIEMIYKERIEKELEKDNIVIIAGFQGVNKEENITTLGRGGSDTTAVAVSAAIDAKHCYIFSDVDGVYSTDPNKVTIAKKLKNLSYDEMQDISEEGAKVLHNRCVEIANKFKIPIITKSTFNNNPGTVINDKIEDTKVKSIVKNDDIVLINMKYESYSLDIFNKIYFCLLKNHLKPNNLTNNSTHYLNIEFTIKSQNLIKFQSLLENELKIFSTKFSDITKISIVGYGIMTTDKIISEIIKIIANNGLEMYSINTTETKITILFKDKISNSILEQLHTALIV